MKQDVTTNVLHRKVSQGNRLRDASAVTPSRALRLALGRIAEDLWDLSVVTTDLRTADLAQETALAELKQGDLILVLTGPGGQCGVVALDRAVLAALIEIQTVGTVFDADVPTRDFTDTDASIAWLFVSRLMAEVSQSLGDLPDAALWRDYRFELRVDDARTAGLYVNTPQYRSYTATVDVADGRRTGDLRLFLPIRREIPPSRSRDDQGAVTGGKGFGLLATPVSVQLCQVSVPLTRACQLKPGDMLDLPADALDRATVRAAGGYLVARGRLGQMNGFRAISLNLPAATATMDEPGALSAPVDVDHDTIAAPIASHGDDLPVIDTDAPLQFATDFDAPDEMTVADAADSAMLDADSALDGFPDWEEEE